MKKISRTTKDTTAIAKEFLQSITSKEHKKAAVVGLSGDLGAGKTALVKAIARHLGIRQTVNSPTFVIIKKYPIKKKGPHKTMYHLDAYRLKNEGELQILGWDKIIGDPQNLVFIEWPENVPKIMPKKSGKIKISLHKKGHRVMDLK
jgi:tRNA threonylcarbamoyladenosine biosynthesis protein TsaE